ncbi:MAG: PAS domain S-box protein [Verrucomicrobiota bacterium]
MVRAFVINRDEQARRLVSRSLQRCGFGVSECESPLFGQDEYAGEPLVVVDVRSLQDDVREFLLWIRGQKVEGGQQAHVIALLTGIEIDSGNHSNGQLWDEVLRMPDEVDRLCECFERFGSRFNDLQGAPQDLDLLSPFELAEEATAQTGQASGLPQRSVESQVSEAELSPSRIEGLSEMTGTGPLAASGGSLDSELFREMAESVPYGLVVLGRDEKFVYGNARHADLLGLGIDEADSVEDWLRRVSPGEEHCREVIASWRKHVWRKQLVRTYALRAENGTVVDIEFRPKLMSDGSLLLTMNNVSDRCRSEEAWLLSDVKFRTLFGSKGLGMALVDRTGRICTVNAALQKMLDYTATELRAMAFDDFVLAADRVEKCEFEDLAKKEPSLAVEEVSLRLRKNGGEVLSVFLGISFMEEAGGPFTAYLVRENKRQDLATMPSSLKESLLQNRALLEVVTDLVLMFDHCGKVTDVSPAGKGCVLDLDALDLKGRFLSDRLPTFWEACVKAGLGEPEFHSNGGLMLEFSLSGGTSCCAHVAGCSQGNYMALIRPADEAIVLQQKPEPQHFQFEGDPEDLAAGEWADQLQTLTSLLNLEIDAMPVDTEKEQRSVLQKHQGRIRAIACLSAAKLPSANGDRVQVSAANYLKTLIEELLQSSALAAELDLEAEVDCVGLGLSARKAFALGLCVTELVSNAIEHGLAEMPGGRVYVRLRRSDREGVLLVGDNGAGLPSGFDLDRVDTLGFRVVKSLTTQLGARLEIRPGENTEFLLRFPLK